MDNQLAKKVQMFRRWWRILLKKSVTAVNQGRGILYSKSEILGYYNDMTAKVSCGTLLDKHGIPLTQIDTGEQVHFPIAIFQYGLGCYDLYLKSRLPDLWSAFMNCVLWAYEQQDDNGAWNCFAPMRSKMYTVSSMGQGEGASLLARAFIATGEHKYKDAALSAIDFMLRDVNDGGTAAYEDNALYLEEYPQIPRRSVLNGWIFSLFGVYDAMLLETGRYEGAFDKSINTLRATLPLYDNGFWSMYDLQNHIASPSYHALHIALLQVLYDLTGISEFHDTAVRFITYQGKRTHKLRAVCAKLWQKLTEHTDVVTVQ